MKIADLISKYPRLNITLLPTPLSYVKGLTEYLKGPKIYVKRDDVGALAFGGNKTRKLEFLMARALAENADTVVTLGGVQSNWVRQTIAAARSVGMEAAVVLEGKPPAEIQGNLLLDMLMGARVIYKPDITQQQEDAEIASEFPITGAIAEELRAAGKRPFLMPLGGATPIGNLGYIAMIGELQAQLAEQHIAPTHIIIATGTGGTHAGMAMGMRLAGMESKLIGFSVSRHTRPKEIEIAEMCNSSMEFYGLNERFSKADILVDYSQVGAGYGDMTEAALEAVRLAARLDGLIMCHTYVGKALAGLISMVRKGELTENDVVILTHTGGGVANFAHAREYLAAGDGHKSRL